MSEKLFRFLLSELDIIRIRCVVGNCSGVIEMSVKNLKGTHKAIACPVCGTSFSSENPVTAPGLLEELGNVLERVKAASQRDKFEIQFIVPEPASQK